MDEQDKIKNKVEKREKFDVFLAYILLIIIIACIGIVLYLKFFNENIETKTEEHSSNYLTIEKISELLNSSDLAEEYTTSGGEFITTVENEAIAISYTKDEKVINLNAKLINNELEINLDENAEFATSIYKEISKIICVYYNNDEDMCKNAVSNLTSDNAVDSIRFVNTDEKNFVYINITKSIDINTSTSNDEYTKETVVEVSKEDYSLNIENTTITGIKITSDESSLVITGHVIPKEENDVFKIVVKLYDENDQVLGEKTKEYTSDSPLVSEEDFTVSFELNDNLKVENIKKYSINVVR